MTWRYTQLGNDSCDQDKLILSLYENCPVRYIGTDYEFARKLNIDEQSKHTVAVFNTAGWLSGLISFVESLRYCQSFYLGINRYVILGNDTTLAFDNSKPNGEQLISLVSAILPTFDIAKSGYFDDDQGKYFNFVQPLTWVYATNKSN